MRRPFVLRVIDDDAARAAAIARDLVAPLAARGARVLLDGRPAAEGGECAVNVLTMPRGREGTAVVIGVSDPHRGARWLAPIDVASADEVVRFLEAWGFLAAPRQVASSRAT